MFHNSFANKSYHVKRFTIVPDIPLQFRRIKTRRLKSEEVCIMRYRLCFKVIFLCLLMNLYAFPLWGKVVFIVNPSSKIVSIDKKMIRDIFFGKIMQWPGGKEIRFILLDDPQVHKDFLKYYIKKNPNQFRDYWKRMLYAGKGLLPQTLKKEDVISFVASHEGAIGYVGEEPVTKNVKILKVRQ